MSINAVRAGTGSAGAGPATPSYPAGITADEAIYCFVGGKPTTANVTTAPTMPAGWSLIGSNLDKGGYGSTLVVDQGNLSVWCYRRDADATGSESGTISITAGFTGAWIAQILSVDSDNGIDSEAVATAEDTVSGDLSLVFGSDPGVAAGDLALLAFATTSDGPTFTDGTGAISQAGVTWGSVTETLDLGTTAAFDMKLWVAHATALAGTSSGAPTATCTVVGGPARGPGLLVRVREAANSADPIEPTTPTVLEHPVAALEVAGSSAVAAALPSAALALVMVAAQALAHPASALAIASGSPTPLEHPQAVLAVAPSPSEPPPHPAVGLGLTSGSPSTLAHPQAVLGLTTSSPSAIEHPIAAIAVSGAAPTPYEHPQDKVEGIVESPVPYAHPAAVLGLVPTGALAQSHPASAIAISSSTPTALKHPQASLVTPILPASPVPLEHPVAWLTVIPTGGYVVVHPVGVLAVVSASPAALEHPQASLDVPEFVRAPSANLIRVPGDNRVIVAAPERPTMIYSVFTAYPGEVLRYGVDWRHWLELSGLTENAIVTSTWEVEAIGESLPDMITMSADQATEEETAVTLTISESAEPGAIYEINNTITDLGSPAQNPIRGLRVKIGRRA